MIINRNNYEEYFLLYNDNELTAHEKRLVEDFVARNTDLKVEFDLLKELKLDPADNFRFDKSSLFKPITLQDDILKPTPEQEKLLLYIDNELGEREKEKLETELKANQNLNNEFALLAKVKISPDLSIVHPDKESLYKEEEQPVRIFRMTWTRVAVAAAVILVMGLLWLNRTSSPATVAPVIAKTSSPELKPDDPQTAGKKGNPVKELVVQPVDIPGKGTDDTPSDINDVAVNTTNAKDKKGVAKTERNISKANTNYAGIVANVKQINIDRQIVASVNPPELKVKTSKVPSLEIDPENVAGVSVIKTKTIDIIDMPSVLTVKSDYATEALLSNNPNEEPETLVQDETPRKGAFRGLLRKANRFVNKVTNTDSNGPSVKVASFEIALAK